MINSMLVAVEDTAASMRAAEVAAELAHRLGGRLRVVTVLQDGVLTDALTSASREPAVAERRERTVAAVLAHVARLAAAVGVQAETCEHWGAPGPQILAEATACGADLIVLGRSGRRDSYDGGVLATVMEFAKVPVLLVP